MGKGAIKSKTMWFGHGIAIFGIIQTNLDLFDITKQQYAMIFVGIAVATYVLRFLTTSALEDK
jgi:uncharacterized membrane protein YeiB